MFSILPRYFNFHPYILNFTHSMDGLSHLFCYELSDFISLYCEIETT